MKTEDRFFDQVQAMLNADQVADGVHLLAGQLHGLRGDEEKWPRVVTALRAHPLHGLLMQDPYVARAYLKPRGYAGDAKMIDLLYTQKAPAGVSELGQKIFQVTTGVQAAQGVRLRRRYAETQLLAALENGRRVLSLACGHFREAASLIGRDLTRVTVVDQDPAALAVVRQDHGDRVHVTEANVAHFLRDAAHRGETWDYVYTLGLTDYFNEQAMTAYHRALFATLSKDGVAMVANFAPDHISVGWMEAVMDWRLFHRDEAQLAAHAQAGGLKARTWRDDTDSIAYCEMTRV